MEWPASTFHTHMRAQLSTAVLKCYHCVTYATWVLVRFRYKIHAIQIN